MTWPTISIEIVLTMIKLSQTCSYSDATGGLQSRAPSCSKLFRLKIFDHFQYSEFKSRQSWKYLISFTFNIVNLNLCRAGNIWHYLRPLHSRFFQLATFYYFGFLFQFFYFQRLNPAENILSLWLLILFEIKHAHHW